MLQTSIKSLKFPEKDKNLKDSLSEVRDQNEKSSSRLKITLVLMYYGIVRFGLRPKPRPRPVGVGKRYVNVDVSLLEWFGYTNKSNTDKKQNFLNGNE